jgi:hypothetical protein
MYKYICTAVTRRNKTETFRLVKPLNCTCCHETSSINECKYFIANHTWQKKEKWMEFLKSAD